jgi:phosphomannomutase/phosphoglucomutase
MKIKTLAYLMSMITSLFTPLTASVNTGIFHEYDIRGKVGSEFEPSDMYGIAHAVASYVREKNPQAHTVALGMDGRIHSAEIKKHITKALLEAGFDVVFVGVCPTPVIYFTMHNLAVDAGLMITASHNPAEYNGLKICLGKEPLFGKSLKEIRDRFVDQKIELALNPGSYREHDMIEPYVDWLAQNFSHLKGITLSAIIDCGNGAGGTVMPQLIEKMQWPNVSLLYAEVDGSYPHHVADPTVEKYMYDLKKAVADSDAELGMGLDGDADRMAPMTKSGKLVSGDRLLAAFAKPLVRKKPDTAIIFDVSSSLGLVKLLRSWGAQPIMSPTGISHLKKRMETYNSPLAGEISCHFAFKDRYFGFDDGVYAALRLIELLHEQHVSLDELLSDFPQTVSSPTYRIPCEHEKRLAVVEALKTAFLARTDVELITVDGVRVNFNNGWGIVRLSNTEPLLSMRFEGFTSEGLKHVKEEFATLMKQHIDCSFLNERKI